MLVNVDQFRCGSLTALLVREVLPQVLVADDYDAILMVVELILRSHAVVVRASSNQEAIQLARDRSFALILLDVHMGRGTTGIQAAQEIRRAGPNQSTPIVFMSGDHMTQDILQSVNGAPCGVLAKPFKATELLQAALPILDSPETAIRARLQHPRATRDRYEGLHRHRRGARSALGDPFYRLRL